MACYVEEEEVWKCPKHPSKRRRNGICPTCLRDRLVTLCPDCHNPRPCACAAASTTSSSSFGGEPSFRRSRSVAIPFLRSRNGEPHNSRVRTPSSFMSILKRSTTKRSGGGGEPAPEKTEPASANDENFNSNNRIEDFARMVTRSRSVSAGTAMTSGFRLEESNSSPAKGKFWNFPSPMKAFRSSRTPKVVIQDRSPLHRG
ncbi:hypothetical protein ABFS82_05G072000 [Erythranthe guttata]|uniref:Uncharacterized protein n=1 Tax=Erythranthe guttata TaxID=4155 RepID=A0A022RU90_ERYGU|nr:PREDICTED: uncharacterized protein LOC105976902 [Erythranthe guttata]EYU44077.1 hypothetical protein MIMGU_mgv1a014129mg [Erythranthe guttata]|eukprot:XP_012857629.1 PREDICTED: uncharacterized protein LOC105976902 [Erythranthe guttata]